LAGIKKAIERGDPVVQNVLAVNNVLAEEKKDWGNRDVEGVKVPVKKRQNNDLTGSRQICHREWK